jgi:hypothetical protein
MSEPEHSDSVYLERISKEMTTIRIQLSSVLHSIKDAESEVPEKIRRYTMYYHDIVHIREAYVTLGIPVPKHIDQEIERSHDRFRQLLKNLHQDDGAFAKVRREPTARSSPGRSSSTPVLYHTSERRWATTQPTMGTSPSRQPHGTPAAATWHPGSARSGITLAHKENTDEVRSE